MPYKIIKEFEQIIADWAGAKYGVAISSCTNALFLCCYHLRVNWVHIPKYTYPGVACSIINSAGKVTFTNEIWQGIYQLRPYPIYDSALRFKKGMYIQDSFYCLSFHIKKHIPIGRGGMILCNDEEAMQWFKKARFDGRNECLLKNDYFSMLGWNMYMTPEQAARGLQLFDLIKDKDLPDIDVEAQKYPDLSKFEIYTLGTK